MIENDLLSFHATVFGLFWGSSTTIIHRIKVMYPVLFFSPSSVR